MHLVYMCVCSIIFPRLWQQVMELAPDRLRSRTTRKGANLFDLAAPTQIAIKIPKKIIIDVLYQNKVYCANTPTISLKSPLLPPLLIASWPGGV